MVVRLEDLADFEIQLEKDSRAKSGYVFVFPYAMREGEYMQRQESGMYGQLIELGDDVTILELLPDEVDYVARNC